VSKAAKNLYLPPDVIEHGERYSRKHRTTLSRLVSDFLRSLPLGETSELAPPVRRLIGAGVSRGDLARRAGEADYRKHIQKKYGKR
jgi:hypothetical protein